MSKKNYNSQYMSYGRNYILKVLGSKENKRSHDKKESALKRLQQVESWINIRKAQLRD